MPEAAASESKAPEVLSCPYFLHCAAEDGTVHKIELTGEKTVSTICPLCGEEHTFTFDAFLDFIKDGALYGTMIYCLKCSENYSKTHRKDDKNE